jgi:hypothetical protein
VTGVLKTSIPEPVLVDPQSVDGALLSVFYGEPRAAGGEGMPFQGKDLTKTPIAELIQVGKCRFKSIDTRVETASSQRLKQQYDEPPSHFGFNANLSRHIQGMERAIAAGATIDSAGLMLQLVGMGNGLSEEKKMALLPHLVRLGGNVSLANEAGHTPLHGAAENASLAVRPDQICRSFL